jgi:hypothetical protein
MIGLCAVGGLAPSGPSSMDEAAPAVNDGGDAHYRQEPSAGHAERWAATAGAHGARLDRVVDTLASLVPERRDVHDDHEQDRDCPRPPSR